jgi:putative Mg2+ transporter-C (MgtC) family protein
MEIEIVLKILLSAVLGGIIGFERELSRKDTGLLTCILIAVGSTLVTILSLKLGDISKSADPTTLTGHLITAIGLLGTGAIVRARFTAHGITTAAIIWVVAAVGISAGSGYYLTGLIVTAFVVLILTSLKYITNLLENQAQTFAYVIATEDRASVLIEIKKITRELDLKYIDSRLRKIDNGYEIEISLSTSKTKNEAFIEKVMQLPGVKEIISEHL